LLNQVAEYDQQYPVEGLSRSEFPPSDDAGDQIDEQKDDPDLRGRW
jgi:hypothetical protein